MQFRFILLPVFFLALCSTSFAQDKIYKKNGDVIEAKIISIAVKTVTYTRFDNQSGPEYTIMKNDVKKIVYQNGSEDEFATGRASRGSRRHHDDADSDAVSVRMPYKPNILSLAPLQFSENGLGVGLSYERAIDKKSIIAFYLPAAVTFNLNNGTYFDPNTNSYQNGKTNAMVYAMPGIKVYPTGNTGMVRYAIGPSLVAGVGQSSSTGYDANNNFIYQTQTHTVLGMIINNSLNINPSQRIYLGLELGLGFTYLNRIGGLNQGTETLVQGGLKIGFRF